MKIEFWFERGGHFCCVSLREHWEVEHANMFWEYASKARAVPWPESALTLAKVQLMVKQ